MMAATAAALALLFAWGRPVPTAPPRPTWKALLSAMTRYCADKPRDLACSHLLPALRKHGRPRRSDWHDADGQHPLPWVHLGDPDPEWIEYDWYIDYSIGRKTGQPEVQKVENVFTP